MTARATEGGNERRSGSRRVQVEQPQDGFDAWSGARCSDARNSPKRRKKRKNKSFRQKRRQINYNKTERKRAEEP